ncbi:hypothetical protein Q644_24285 [Brucella intermedia 229E]|uniref:Uncharacterized protein n=1 Tax=Brucella intermedia 229E TaxID=1337887 RepID=U4VDL0_9HYPH|nr:hypothetical protein Q644_24285 [Brucella intermedia 229E]
MIWALIPNWLKYSLAALVAAVSASDGWISRWEA